MSHQESAASGQVHLELCIRRAGQSIEGTCHERSSGITRSFWGWMELISALETSTTSGASGASGPIPTDADPELEHERPQADPELFAPVNAGTADPCSSSPRPG